MGWNTTFDSYVKASWQQPCPVFHFSPKGVGTNTPSIYLMTMALAKHSFPPMKIKYFTKWNTNYEAVLIAVEDTMHSKLCMYVNYTT